MATEVKERVISTLEKEGYIDTLKAQLRRKVVEHLEAEKRQQLGSAGKYI